MAEDWLADVRKYVADADEKVVGAIVRYCGIALQKRDSSLVAFSDTKETDRVRENYLKKKLGLTQDDTALDAAINSVGERMKADRTKNRVTVYYLLAERFGLLGIFGGSTNAAGIGAASAMGLAALAPTAAEAASDGTAVRAIGTQPLAAPAAAPAAGGGNTATAYASAGRVRVDDLGWGWLLWLLGGILLAAFLAMALRAVRQGPEPMPDSSAVVTAPAAQPPAAIPTPQGAGVVAAERDTKPMMTVYFDTGKAAVSEEIEKAAAAVKTYVEGHPGAALAVSGFNDPTGNAAANAELSKNRAKNVKAALEGLGIPADKVLLEKPAETSGTGANNSESRRVEVVVKE